MFTTVEPMQHTGPNERRVLPRKEHSAKRLQSEDVFHKALQHEHLRASRTGRRFVLVRVEFAAGLGASGDVDEFLRELSSKIRVTDVVGWYEENVSIGVLFTEIGSAHDHVVSEALTTKINTVLETSLGSDWAARTTLRSMIYPVPRIGAAVVSPMGEFQPLGRRTASFS